MGSLDRSVERDDREHWHAGADGEPGRDIAQVAQRVPDVRLPCAPVLRDPNLQQTWHPDALVLRGRSVREEQLELFESEREEYALTGSIRMNARALQRGPRN